MLFNSDNLLQQLLNILVITAVIPPQPNFSRGSCYHGIKSVHEKTLETLANETWREAEWNLQGCGDVMLLSPSVQLPATLCHPVCHSKGHIILHSNSCVVVVVWRLQTKEATRGAYLPEKLGETGANTPLTHKLQHRIRLPRSLEKHLDVNTWDKSTTVFLETQIHSHVDLHHF